MALADGLVEGEDGIARCWWGGGTDLEYRAYHDDEWGLPVTDDVRLFEKLTLEGFQAGLSWLTILRKREAFRQAFAGFDFRRVARFGPRDVDRLLSDASIVRHRGKIESAINNARRTEALVDEAGSLAAFIWRFEPPDAARPRRITRGALERPLPDGRVPRAREGAPSPRVDVRRADHRLCIHAGDGPRRRSSRRLRVAAPGGSGEGGADPSGVTSATHTEPLE